MADQATFGVKGMSCNHCKMAVERALKGLDGITDVLVNLDKANVTVTYDAGIVGLEQIKETIKDGGYQPE